MSKYRPLKRRLLSPSPIHCESLEERRLLTPLVVSDTPAIDVITLGVTGGGIKVILNGVETDYKPNQWDSVLVSSSAGADTINVQATIVPTIVHYAANGATVNIGDAGGVQNIKADLNANGVMGGPVAEGTATINIDDTGDAAPRAISMITDGQQQIIAGLAPAKISIGVVVPPLLPISPGSGVSQENLTLSTGASADTLTISQLRSALDTSLFNAGGNDAINIGGGSLAQIDSDISIWGIPGFLSQTNKTSLKLDDASDAFAAQFTFSAIYPPGPGAIVDIDFQGAAIPTQRVSFRIAEISSATLTGGSGGNKFLVQALPARNTPDGPNLTLNAGNGSDSVTLNTTAAGTLVNINGQGGNDTFRAGPLGPFAPTGINGNLNFDGGAGADTLTILGPESNPLDIPTVPDILTVGLAQHRDLTIHYADIAKLQIENGNYQIDNDLGHIALFIASEPSVISFESTISVTINATQNLNALDISAGPVTLAAGAGIVLNTDSLHITGGSLDIADNSLQVHYAGGVTPFTSIRAAIFAHGIFTSSADAHHTLGYADSADGIVPTLPTSTVVVTYALFGDANLDRKVNFSDLVIVAQHYGLSPNANWDEGDFNQDGAVGFADLVLLAQNYGSAFPAAAAAPPTKAAVFATPAAALVPAPKAASRVAAGTPVFATRRQRRR